MAPDGGKLNGLLLVDMSKAFDSITHGHRVLLGKLELLGMSGRTLEWFKSYFADRQQSVYVNGELPETHQIALGVPQGSILGPLVFNSYIKCSLPTAVEKSRTILYADDAVLIYSATTPLELNKILQRDFSLI